ncbi:M16 family metallopeptidase [Tenacibaculum xiamenense]|uniref:M16 family metallopeptidase n=1 Tax=Tenacibaculum xiamenense TaxID=1261553 RepID=UPI003895FACA
MRKKLLFLFLCCVTLSFVKAQSKTPSQEIFPSTSSHKIPNDPSVKIGKLSNGLTYYIKQNEIPENKLELRLVVKAGSILEDDDQLGVAHFLEHMLFNGTKNFKKNELISYLESIGVGFGSHLNAETGFDETSYILPIPSDDEVKLEKGFQILEDWAHNALLTDEDINEERGVILQEYRGKQEAGYKELVKTLPFTLYGTNYSNRLPIGTEESIKTFKPESLRRFYKDWYRPDLMAVIAVGDADVKTIEQKIKSHFEKIPLVKNPRKKLITPLKNHEETLISIQTDKELSHSKVQLYYKNINTIPANTEAEYQHNIFKILVTRMINNRLQELAQSKNAPYINASIGFEDLCKEKDFYSLIASTAPNTQLIALKVLLEEKEKAKRFGFNHNEFERVKNSYFKSVESIYNNKDKIASEYHANNIKNSFLNKKAVINISWEYDVLKELLPSISLEHINTFVRQHFNDDNRVVLISGPDVTITKSEVKKALQELKTKVLIPYRDESIASSLMTDIPEPGQIIDTAKDSILGTTTFTLENGAKVTYKKTNYKNDQVLFHAFRFGGTSKYSMENFEATKIAYDIMVDNNYGIGLNGYTKTEMIKILTDKNCSVSPFINKYNLGFNGGSTTKDLEELFKMIHLYFTTPFKDKKSYQLAFDKYRSLVSTSLNNPDNYFQMELENFLSKGNYKNINSPYINDFEKADYDLAFKKYQESFNNPSNFNFYFVGSIDEILIQQYIKNYIASIGGKRGNEFYKSENFRPLSGSHKKILFKGSQPNSTVYMKYQGENKYNKKEAIAFKLLGDIISIKLNESLREKEADTYSPSAGGYIQKFPYGWYELNIGFSCNPDKVDKLKAIVEKQISILITNGPSEEVLMKVRNILLANYKEQSKLNEYWLEQIVNVDLLKNEPKDVFTFEKRLNEITTKDIQNIAKKYLTNGYILGVLNPEK